MSTTTQHLATYKGIREITDLDEIQRRIDAIHDGKASPGRPYPDEVRELCRRKQVLEGKR